MLRRALIEEVCKPTAGFSIGVKLSSASDFAFVAFKAAIIRRTETSLDLGHRGPWGARVVHG